jgi:hypothetical protein
MSTDRRPMHRADKAVLRLAFGFGLAVLVAYGLAMQAPFLICILTFAILCKPGPPIPLAKGMVLIAVIGALTAAGMLMVPVLENYALAGVAMTAALLYLVFLYAVRSTGPMPTILVMAVAVIPVAGVAEQALASALVFSFSVGVFVGIFVSSMSHALFPNPPLPAVSAAEPAGPDIRAARWMATRATLVMLPVFVLALSNPAFYLAALMKTSALGQQACSTTAQSAGRELVGSTLMGAWLAVLVWFGLSLRPNLWMLMLWLVAAALWVGVRLFRIKATSFPPPFWLNAVVNMLVLLGPAIEDSANGKDVFKASVVRVSLFIAISIYAWAVVWLLESLRKFRSRSPLPGGL